MATGSFTKLFSSITASTIWCEPNHVRIVWITLLAMANRDGEVAASVPGLAGIARVTVNECRDAIKRCMSPDKDSRTKAFEGRRLAEINGGWKILNYGFYRQIQDAETVKEAKRKWWNENRGLESTRKTRTDLIQAEAEADIKTIAQNFAQFWEAYPKKKSKGDAEKAWKKLNPDSSLVAEIQRAVELAKASEDWLKEDGKYIPYPATWLRAKGWEDEHKSPRLESVKVDA